MIFSASGTDPIRRIAIRRNRIPNSRREDHAGDAGWHKLSGPVPGAAEFVLQGKTYRLEPVLEDPDAKNLFFILRDTTSATTTYGACRFLYTEFPSSGLDRPGELVLDFNRLQKPAVRVHAIRDVPTASSRKQTSDRTTGWRTAIP